MKCYLKYGFRHGSSKKGPRRNKRGVWSRGRSGQVIAAHHARIRMGSIHSQIKKRMQISAIDRAKRIGDHGRKAVPVVKVEQGHNFSSLEGDVEKTSRSDEDDYSNDDCPEATSKSSDLIIVDHEVASAADIQASVVNEKTVESSVQPKSLKRAVAGGKLAAANARKKLARNRKNVA